MAKVELKQPIIDEIHQAVSGASSVVLVDYRGLTVDEDTRLRKTLREAGINYKVYKNKLMIRAFKGTPFESLKDELAGPNAIAISKEDATLSARLLKKFAKEAKALELKAGVVEGTFYDEAQIKALADIPSREELLSKFLGSIQSPITNFARVLNQIAEASGTSETETSDTDVKVEEPVEVAAVEEVKATETPVVEKVKEETKTEE